MPDLLWKPPAALTPGARSVAAPSRLGHFLGLSAALHLGMAALAPWLAVLVPSPADEELVRPIDFLSVADADAGAEKPSGPAGTPAPLPGSGRPVAGRAAARAAKASVPAPAPERRPRRRPAGRRGGRAAHRPGPRSGGGWWRRWSPCHRGDPAGAGRRHIRYLFQDG